ncbi:hypothetical protein LCGC14_1747750 [marine sediment metagenome]|uniref:Uncharacterized protein n=1 Tax=marine sediment metagenome TaxID=412755 RepID=A0A0F9JJZ4_9ZZZZ
MGSAKFVVEREFTKEELDEHGISHIIDSPEDLASWKRSNGVGVFNKELNAARIIVGGWDVDSIQEVK